MLTAARVALLHPPALIPLRPNATPYDEARFCTWLADAPSGARIIYYRGLLAFERMPSAGVLDQERRQRLARLASRALQAAEDGRVHLLQRRLGDNDYLYIAIKARPKARPHLRLVAAGAGR